MIERGEVPRASNLIRTRDREGRFIWLNDNHLATQYVLISREEHRNISINEVLSVSVALSKGTGYTDFFNKWFPDHNYAIVYENIFAAKEAFLRGETDMLMGNKNSFLHLSHFMEIAGYKINYVFKGDGYNSTFGFNKDEVILASIFNKALDFIDTDLIFDQWQNKTFDYRFRVTEAQREAQRPLFIGLSVLGLIILTLVVAFLVKSRNDGRRLKKLVEERTNELELRTAMLTTLFDSTPAHIFAKDLDLLYTQCNKGLLEYFSLSKEDIIGKDDIDGLGVPAETSEKFREIDKQVIRKGELIKVEEYVPGADGNIGIYEILKAPLVLNDSVIGVLGISLI